MTASVGPTHHPDEAVLLDHAAGSLAPSFALVVATHLALCPACRKSVARMEAMGAAALETLPPADVPKGLRADVLARLGPQDAKPEPPRAHGGAPRGLPRPLRDFLGGELSSLTWKGVGGVEIHPLPTLRAGHKTYLMKISGGAQMPRHTHRGMEMTLVLEGGFSDVFGSYGPGDLSQADEAHVHSPKADPEGCVCLATTQNPLRMGGIVSGLVARWFGV